MSKWSSFEKDHLIMENWRMFSEGKTEEQQVDEGVLDFFADRKTKKAVQRSAEKEQELRAGDDVEYKLGLRGTERADLYDKDVYDTTNLTHVFGWLQGYFRNNIDRVKGSDLLQDRNQIQEDILDIIKNGQKYEMELRENKKLIHSFVHDLLIEGYNPLSEEDTPPEAAPSAAESEPAAKPGKPTLEDKYDEIVDKIKNLKTFNQTLSKQINIDFIEFLQQKGYNKEQAVEIYDQFFITLKDNPSIKNKISLSQHQLGIKLITDAYQLDNESIKNDFNLLFADENTETKTAAITRRIVKNFKKDHAKLWSDITTPIFDFRLKVAATRRDAKGDADLPQEKLLNKFYNFLMKFATTKAAAGMDPVEPSGPYNPPAELAGLTENLKKIGDIGDFINAINVFDFDTKKIGSEIGKAFTPDELKELNKYFRNYGARFIKTYFPSNADQLIDRYRASGATKTEKTDEFPELLERFAKFVKEVMAKSPQPKTDEEESIEESIGTARKMLGIEKDVFGKALKQARKDGKFTNDELKLIHRYLLDKSNIEKFIELVKKEEPEEVATKCPACDEEAETRIITAQRMDFNYNPSRHKGLAKLIAFLALDPAGAICDFKCKLVKVGFSEDSIDFSTSATVGGETGAPQVKGGSGIFAQAKDFIKGGITYSAAAIMDMIKGSDAEPEAKEAAGKELTDQQKAVNKIDKDMQPILLSFAQFLESSDIIDEPRAGFPKPDDKEDEKSAEAEEALQEAAGNRIKTSDIMQELISIKYNIDVDAGERNDNEAVAVRKFNAFKDKYGLSGKDKDETVALDKFFAKKENALNFVNAYIADNEILRKVEELYDNKDKPEESPETDEPSSRITESLKSRWQVLAGIKR